VDAANDSLLEELHGFARAACVPSLCEAIRLLESDKFRELTGRDIQDVANYRGIELGDEWFFHKAFTTGKEAAASLAFAQQLGPEVVLDDLQRLRESLGVET
jgi:hypothetical protein